MKITFSLAAFVLPLLAAAQTYTIPPPTTAPPDTILDCTNWYVGVSSDTCAFIASSNGITLQQLYSYVRIFLSSMRRVELIHVSRTLHLHPAAISNPVPPTVLKKIFRSLLLPQPQPRVLQPHLVASSHQPQSNRQDLLRTAISFTTSRRGPLALTS